MQPALAFRHPTRIVPGACVVAPGRSTISAGLTDILPTLLDFASVTGPDGGQGHSLAPRLRGDMPEASAPKYSFCERVSPHRDRRRIVEPTASASFAARGDGWKYVRHADGEEYLYDLTSDPGETQNRAGDGGPARATMRAALEQWLVETEYPGR